MHREPLKMTEDGPCYYCDEDTDNWNCNPNRWSLQFCHADEPGVVKHHHVSCVTERLREYADLTERCTILEERIGYYKQRYRDEKTKAFTIIQDQQHTIKKLKEQPDMEIWRQGDKITGLRYHGQEFLPKQDRMIL